MQLLFNYSFTCLLLFCLSALQAQPSNDACATATPLTVGATCTYQNYSNLNATDSGDGSPSCGFYLGGDVWFSLTVPASGKLVIDQDFASLTNTAMSVYTGSCGALVEYECDDNHSPNGSMPQIVINDLALASQTIYIQVWRTGNANGGTFQICAFEPTIPANVDCANATALTVGASCSYQTFSNEYAGNSGDGGPSCGFYVGTDIWFSLTVPASGKLVIDQETADLTNTAMSVYTGVCSALVEYECDDNHSPNGNMPQVVINDLSLANQTLYIQVWRTGIVNGGTFQICAFEPTIPANVDCANATALTVGASCSYQTFTNEYAGNSGDGGPSCGFYNGSDVWFSLTVPASGKLVIDQDFADLTNSAMSVYTGSCGALVEYECDDNHSPHGLMPQIVINDLTLANQTLYIQVWNANSVNGGTFQICAFEPTIPANVDCANATALTVGTTCSYQTFTNEYAGNSGDGGPSCGFYNGSDVWFSLTVPVSGKLVIDQDFADLTNSAMSVYTGICGALVQYECDDNHSPNGLMPQIVINDLALANQTLYIQVWNANSVNGGTFQICAFEPTIPANVDCANAQMLPLSNANAYLFYTNEYAGSSGDGSPTCGFYVGTDVWFTAEVSSTGQLTLDQIQGALMNTAMSVYTGTCGALTEYECDDNTSTNGLMPKIEIDDVSLASQTVYIQVWHTNSVNGGTFGLTAFDPGNPIFPVEWLDIQAEPWKESQIRVSWKTARETENDFFIVERSMDGRLYTEMGRVEAGLSPSSVQSYSFLDIQPLDGQNIYRIRQVDYNGQYSYSPQIQINWNQAEPVLSIYPNPAKEVATLRLSAPADWRGMIEILDLQGRSLSSQIIHKPDQAAFVRKVDVSTLAAGVYHLLLFDQHHRLVGMELLMKE